MKILAIATDGGHFTQLLELALSFEEFNHIFVTTRKQSGLPGCIVVKSFKVTNPLSILRLAFHSFSVLLKIRPKVILSTGAEIAIPFIVFGKLFFRSKVIFVESSAKVVSPTATGRLMYYFSDSFYVQWPSMLKVYGPKARFVGGLLCSL